MNQLNRACARFQQRTGWPFSPLGTIAVLIAGPFAFPWLVFAFLWIVRDAGDALIGLARP